MNGRQHRDNSAAATPKHPKFPYYCEMCDKGCYTQGYFNSHLNGRLHREKTNSPKQEFYCELCDKKCYTIEYFNNHLTGRLHEEKMASMSAEQMPKLKRENAIE